MSALTAAPAASSSALCPSGARPPHSQPQPPSFNPFFQTTLDRLHAGTASAWERKVVARGAPLVTPHSPCECMQAMIDHDNHVRSLDAAWEDAEGRLPHEAGYSGFCDLPDVRGRIYYEHGYLGPDPALKAERIRTRTEIAEKVVDLQAFRANKLRMQPEQPERGNVVELPVRQQEAA